MTHPAPPPLGPNRPPLDPDRQWCLTDSESVDYLEHNGDERVVALRGSADAMRRVIASMKDTALDSAALDRVTAHLERAVAELRRADGSADDQQRQPGLPLAGTTQGAHRMMEFSPVTGRSNPLAVPMRYWADPERVTAEFTYTAAYEGPPGCVHGGFVAVAFDEVLSLVPNLIGKPAVTAKLAVDYHAPTPLDRPLRIEAWLEHTSGRRVSVHGTLSAGDVLCAKASALYVTVDFTKMASRLAQIHG